MFSPSRCYCLLCMALAVLLAAFILLADAPAARAQDKKPVSFINDVAPILKENCFACHDAKKRKGKLDMTTVESLRKGGSGEIDPISPGKPDDSHIIEVLTSTTAARMPPKESGEALPKEKIAIIERWIREGAKLDEGITAKADLVKELRKRWVPPAPPAAYPGPERITALAFTNDNAKLVAGGYHELTVWGVTTGKLEKRIRTRAERAKALAFLPDGKLVVAGGRPGQEGDVVVYDINGGKPTMEGDVAILDGVNDKAVKVKQLQEADDEVLALALSGDGKRIAAGGTDRVVTIWDIAGGLDKATVIFALDNIHADWIMGLALTPDGRYIATASRDKTAKVWDTQTKELVVTFPGHQANVYGVAIKADGKTAYSVGDDSQLRTWTVAPDGKAIRQTGGHSKAVLRLVQNPKQPILATCGADATVRLWNADSGAALKTLSGHTDWVYSVAFSPDGALVAAGSHTGDVRIWKVADGAEVKAFNASPGYKPAAPPK